MFVDDCSSGADAGPQVANSLRFDGSNDYLIRTMSAPTDQKKWTWSGWVKRSRLGGSTTNTVFAAQTDANNKSSIRFEGTDTLVFSDVIGGTGTSSKITSALYRDPSSHYHVVCSYDTANATDADRVQLHVNGVRITAFNAPNTNPTINYASGKLNTAMAHTIGQYGSEYFDGYLSNVCFIDGSALTPSSFGYTDTNNQWRSKSKSELTALASAGGANSFFLPFDDGASTTTLGNDVSSKNNDWTLTNMVRDGSVNDCWMLDTPTNNFATLNPLNSMYSLACTNGNLTAATAAATYDYLHGVSIGASSGKWYYEVTCGDAGSGNDAVGFLRDTMSLPGTSAGGYSNASFYGYLKTGQKLNGAATAYNASWTTGDILGIAFDITAGSIEFFKNNTSQGVAFTSLSGNFIPAVMCYNSGSLACNFGQRPVALGAFDSASGGYFRYTPPAGFKALCTKNLPDPSIKLPNKHFDVKLHSGNGSAVTVTGTQFAPDFVWVKARGSTTGNNVLADTIRGVGKALISDSTVAEITDAQTITAFTPDGFSYGSEVSGNRSGNSMVDWLWKAGGAAVSNTAGSITSQVSANPAAGFSIVTYTGTGANATVGHGLGVAPKMVIVKNRVGGTQPWVVYNANLNGGVTPANYYLYLQTTAAQAAYAPFFNDTAPTSSLFSVGTDNATNGSTNTFIAYCFAEIPGYSKIGSYVGNASTDGPFVYCGFKPKYLLVKCTAAADWVIVDASRDIANPEQLFLYPNLAVIEQTAASFDFTANGFKVRNTIGNVNGSGSTYTFMAIAEAPFKYSGAK